MNHGDKFSQADNSPGDGEIEQAMTAFRAALARMDASPAEAARIRDLANATDDQIAQESEALRHPDTPASDGRPTAAPAARADDPPMPSPPYRQHPGDSRSRPRDVAAPVTRDQDPPGARRELVAVGTLVQPYTVTGGRTQPRYLLPIEALVTATIHEPRDLSVLAPECQAILQFCRDWRSVAEISAVLRLPLGVARILVADMAADGLVRIDLTDYENGRPDLNLLERVLSGLRKI